MYVYVWVSRCYIYEERVKNGPWNIADSGRDVFKLDASPIPFEFLEIWVLDLNLVLLPHSLILTLRLPRLG